MERRTFEAPMDWEYQNHGPMDPSSPFVQSTRRLQQQKNVFGSSSNFNTFGQNNPLSRTQSTPSASNALASASSQPASIFSTSHLTRTATAPPFRNPAFTTPRKPFDTDALSEISPADSSPAATDVSDFADTPENDGSYSLDKLIMAPASVHRNKHLLSRKQSGKGEIKPTVFPNRDKVRKRKRYNDNKDISGYRLPYRQHDEWEESEDDSDESTTEPGRPGHEPRRKRSKDGWLGNFLSVIQRHPHAPAIMSYWLNTLFNFVMVLGSFFLMWTIWSGFRDDFLTARRRVQDDVLAEIEKCTSNYRTNKCAPIEQRLPAMHQLCDEWYECMMQREDPGRTVRTAIKEIAEMLNSAVETLHWKTLIVLGVLLLIVLFSGASLVKSAGSAGDYLRQQPPPPPTPFPSAYQHHPHPADRIAWEQLAPQTPRHFNPRHLTRFGNDETPDTDASPEPSFRALTAPHTPGTRRGGSPTKLDRLLRERERERSPTKSRSPTKRY
ncbi:hypothetical protein DL767_002308 [Monosporascus sp. MG133]|nr:hypothetical protein DL767_002308 [Monosporascus sp. MG133]